MFYPYSRLLLGLLFEYAYSLPASMELIRNLYVTT